jgi:hypothetical protein
MRLHIKNWTYDAGMYKAIIPLGDEKSKFFKMVVQDEQSKLGGLPPQDHTFSLCRTGEGMYFLRVDDTPDTTPRHLVLFKQDYLEPLRFRILRNDPNVHLSPLFHTFTSNENCSGVAMVAMLTEGDQITLQSTGRSGKQFLIIGIEQDQLVITETTPEDLLKQKIQQDPNVMIV